MPQTEKMGTKKVNSKLAENSNVKFENLIGFLVLSIIYF